MVAGGRGRRKMMGLEVTSMRGGGTRRRQVSFIIVLYLRKLLTNKICICLIQIQREGGGG